MATSNEILARMAQSAAKEAKTWRAAYEEAIKACEEAAAGLQVLASDNAKLKAEVLRTHTLIRAAEFSYPFRGSTCPWCGEKQTHAENCNAFTSDRKLKTTLTQAAPAEVIQ